MYATNPIVNFDSDYTTSNNQNFTVLEENNYDSSNNQKKPIVQLDDFSTLEQGTNNPVLSTTIPGQSAGGFDNLMLATREVIFPRSL